MTLADHVHGAADSVYQEDDDELEDEDDDALETVPLGTLTLEDAETSASLVILFLHVVRLTLHSILRYYLGKNRQEV